MKSVPSGGPLGDARARELSELSVGLLTMLFAVKSVSGKYLAPMWVILREPKRLEESRAIYQRGRQATGSFDSFHSLRMARGKYLTDAL